MEDTQTHKIILYNDDVNSHEYVMACLIGLCKHEVVQAEQCALIAHNKGKCEIKHGDFMDMFELKTTFDNLNIKVELEEYESDLH